MIITYPTHALIEEKGNHGDVGCNILFGGGFCELELYIFFVILLLHRCQRQRKMADSCTSVWN